MPNLLWDVAGWGIATIGTALLGREVGRFLDLYLAQLRDESAAQ